MNETTGFTIFPNERGTGILVVVDPESPMYGQTFNPSMRGDNPTEVTLAFLEYLELMVSAAHPQTGTQLFAINTKTAIASSTPSGAPAPATTSVTASESRYKQPKVGDIWTHGVDDRLIITQIIKDMTEDRTSVTYKFFSSYKKKPTFPVRVFKEADLASTGIIEKMAGQISLEGQFYLTVQLQSLKKGKEEWAGFAESYYCNLVSIEEVG